MKNLDPSIDKYPENLVHKILKQVSSMCQWGVKKSYQYYIFASLFCEFFDSVDEIFVKIAMFLNFAILENESKNRIQNEQIKEEAFVTFQL